jgi:putative copper export protein
MDWLHLLAAALWGGVVVAFVIALCQPLRQKPDAQRVAVLTRLSRLAGLGLGLALVTGVYNAWQRLGGWAPLWTTHYGHLLDIKILLVFLMALLGASNHFWHVPAARVAEANEPFFPSVAFLRLLQIARLETILILLILVVVAMLVSGVPPARLH